MAAKTPHIEEIVREYYPHYTASEIIAMKPYGQTPSKRTIDHWARRLGVRSTEEKQRRIDFKRAEHLHCVPDKHTDIIAKKMHEHYKREYRRVNAGLPQKTRLRLKSLPRRTQMAKGNLMGRHKYIPTTVPLLLWYDERTRRTKNEDYFTEKYGIRFAPSEE